MGVARTSAEQRIWGKFNVGDGCWEWTAGLNNNNYGHISIGGRGSSKVLGHRVVYQQMVGPVPEGMELDHLCRNTKCVRPDHLEPVTHRENMLRGDTFAARNASLSHCKNGHPFSAVNTYAWRGSRHCRTCRRERYQRSRRTNG